MACPGPGPEKLIGEIMILLLIFTLLVLLVFAFLLPPLLRRHRASDVFIGRDMRTLAITIIVVALPLLAGALYAHLGSPMLPGKPFVERVNDPEYTLVSATEQMAVALKSTPDAGGYKKLGGMFSLLRQYDRSADAYRESIELGGRDATTWSALGEAIVMANDGVVARESLHAFRAAYKLHRDDARAQFYIGLAAAQVGDFKKAVSIWRDLEKNSPSDASWMAVVKGHITAYAKEGRFDPASVLPSPPILGKD
ncbi:MAG: tetratricopeptide repeat protein [Proteobacteria bacterium]|nr:tetratricopeptide repeat protein [Pseudomonadota bacterium]